MLNVFSKFLILKFSKKVNLKKVLCLKIFKHQQVTRVSPSCSLMSVHFVYTLVYILIHQKNIQIETAVCFKEREKASKRTLKTLFIS